MGLDFRDVKTIKYTPNELSLRYLQISFLPVPLVLTAHVPFYLPEVFNGKNMF